MKTGRVIASGTTYTQVMWLDHVRQWLRCGVGAKAFAQGSGYQSSALAWHRTRLRREGLLKDSDEVDGLMKHWLTDFWSQAGAWTPPNLHPYENVERVFRHTDKTRRPGLEIVAQLLKVDSRLLTGNILFELSFYSGGIGVLDNLAVTLPATTDFWNQISDHLTIYDPEAAVTDETWNNDFLWLVKAENHVQSARIAAIRFINTEKRDFQSLCDGSSTIAFQRYSDVNDWVVLWGDDKVPNYRGYSQG